MLIHHDAKIRKIRLWVDEGLIKYLGHQDDMKKI